MDLYKSRILKKYSKLQLESNIEILIGKQNNLYGIALFPFCSTIKCIRAICWRKLTNGSTDSQVLGTRNTIVSKNCEKNRLPYLSGHLVKLTSLMETPTDSPTDSQPVGRTRWQGIRTVQEHIAHTLAVRHRCANRLTEKLTNELTDSQEVMQELLLFQKLDWHTYLDTCWNRHV